MRIAKFLYHVFLILCGTGLFLSGHAATRAFSLKQLQQQLQDDGSTDNPMLTYLCGLTAADGFVMDRENGDVIIYGRVDENALPLHTQDFVVAMRNASMKYARFEDNTYYYHNPGCSIDPNPGVIAKLQDLSQRINAVTTVAGKDSALQAWHDICGQPQTVKVFGVPFESRFASIMVEADYLLKSITDGSYTLDVPGFTGLLPAIRGQMEEDVKAGKSISVGIAAMNRFWFYPGDYDFLYNSDMAGISSCPVELLTEAQYVNSSHDQLVGSGNADPAAAEYTQSFTQHWQELAAIEPLFAELEGLYRLTALAKLIEHYKAGEVTSLDYLLDEYELPEAQVPESLTGVSNIQRFEHTSETDDGSYTVVLWLPSCGGVGMDLEVSPKHLTQDIDGKLDVLKQRILKAKPKKDALFWDVN